MAMSGLLKKNPLIRRHISLFPLLVDLETNILAPSDLTIACHFSYRTFATQFPLRQRFPNFLYSWRPKHFSGNGTAHQYEKTRNLNNLFIYKFKTFWILLNRIVLSIIKRKTSQILRGKKYYWKQNFYIMASLLSSGCFGRIRVIFKITEQIKCLMLSYEWYIDI